MNGPVSWFSSTRRLIRILWTVRRFGLDELLVSGAASTSGSPWLLRATRWLRVGTIREPRGVRLRLAFESLGPIFVKFGQVLSTRRDLMPPDIADGAGPPAGPRPPPSRPTRPWPRSSAAWTWPFRTPLPSSSVNPSPRPPLPRYTAPGCTTAPQWP